MLQYVGIEYHNILTHELNLEKDEWCKLLEYMIACINRINNGQILLDRLTRHLLSDCKLVITNQDVLSYTIYPKIRKVDDRSVI